MSKNILYRGLHDDEIKAMTLIPKKPSSFLQELKTPFETPARTGLSRENAGRHHERYSDQSPGVSTTTSYKAAIRYAHNVAQTRRNCLSSINTKHE